MATIKFFSSADMSRVNLRLGDVLISNSSKILISNGYNGGIYYGQGFSYDYYGITGGVVTGYDSFTNFRTYDFSFDVEASVRDINIPALLVYEYIKNGDVFGLLKYTISGDDNINGSKYDDYLFGDSGKDNINGREGNDFIEGDVDSDKLFGGFGNDVIYGGSDDDLMDGGNGSDIYLFFSEIDRTKGEIRDSGINYSGSEEGDYDVVNFVSDVPGSTLKLYSDETGIEEVRIVSGSNDFGIPDDINLNIDASELNYGLAIIGHYGSDSLFGGSGDDILVGFKGDDFINGGSGFDFAVYSYEIKPVIVNLSSNKYQKTGDSGSDKLINIEGLIGGSANDTLTGNLMDNVISGGAGNDRIRGGKGADVLFGEDGADALDGGNGVDRMEGGAGSDTYVVDNADDLIIEAPDSDTDVVKASVSYTLGANIERLVLIGSGRIDAWGNSLSNTIIGNRGGNDLLGLGGNDSLSGYAGSDRLFGGVGKDTLTGGSGQDVFVFDTAPGPANVDKITDFSLVDGDKIQLSKAVFKGFTNLGALTSDEFYAAAGATKAHDASDRIIYNTTTGKLYYDADGFGGAAAIQVALLGTTTNPALSYTDIQIVA